MARSMVLVWLGPLDFDVTRRIHCSRKLRAEIPKKNDPKNRAWWTSKSDVKTTSTAVSARAAADS